MFIFNFSHHSFNFLFLSYFLYRSFFQFSPSIAISHMFCFFILVFFIIFFLDTFVKVFLTFNFIIQSKFLLFYFF